MFPLAWFPACCGHRTKDHRGPTLLCTIAIDGHRLRLSPKGTVSIEVAACINDHCIAAHAWAYAYVRIRFLHLLSAALRPLAGEVWDIDPVDLPDHVQARTDHAFGLWLPV